MLVTISRYSFPYEAHIAKSKLASANIPAFIADEHTIAMQWLYSNALGGVKLQVPAALAKEAQALLCVDNSTELITEQGEDKFLCPACGSKDTEYVLSGRKFNFLMIALSFFPFWPIKKTIKCNTCGESTRYKT